MILHCCSDNVQPPQNITPGSAVMGLSYSPAIRLLKSELKADQWIIYIGRVGYTSPATGAKFGLHTYAIVDQVYSTTVQNVGW